MAEVTTGRDLNSYDGSAALGTGEAAGYAKIDLAPLQTYALHKYETNLLDYEQQQKDKTLLQDQFNDPNLYQFVDQELADQLKPDMDRLKELMKGNLQMKPNSADWYEFHTLHDQLVTKNANAKAVQVLKDKAKKSAGESADPHKKESYMAYADQLGKYKLGDEVPAYNEYFSFDAAHVPTGAASTGKKERIGKDGNIETIQFSILNPLNLTKEYDRLEVADPKATQTWKDIAHTTLETGGVPELKTAMADTYEKARLLNVAPLYEQNKAAYDKYIKANPESNFREFMQQAGKGGQLKDIEDGLAFLKSDLKPVPAESSELPGFTYYTDRDGVKSRLSVDDKTLGAIYGATQNPPGARETVLSSKVSKLPSDIAENQARTRKLDTERQTGAAESKAKIGALNALRSQRLASARLTGKKSAAVEEMTNPIQTFDELFGGKMFSGVSARGNNITRVNVQDMTPDFAKNLTIKPINQNGDYNIVPTGIKFNGMAVKEEDAQKMYEGWLKAVPPAGKTKNAAAELGEKLGTKPNIFHFMYAMGATFVPEIEGMDATDPTKFARSNRMQSWTTQTKDLKAAAAKLLMEQTPASEDNTIPE